MQFANEKGDILPLVHTESCLISFKPDKNYFKLWDPEFAISALKTLSLETVALPMIVVPDVARSGYALASVLILNLPANLSGKFPRMATLPE